MRTLHVTEEEYQLDRLNDERDIILSILSATLENNERYWFYRYEQNMKDTIELNKKIKDNDLI